MASKDDLKENVTSTMAKWKAGIDGLKPKIEQLEGDAKEKIEEQLAKWKPAIDSVKGKAEHAEVEIKEKLHNQLESLSASSQDAWNQVKSSAEQGWNELARAAKSTVERVREVIASPSHDEEIREIAYGLWLDEGRPHGRHQEHWLKAEEVWRERQAAQPPATNPTAPRTAKKAPAPRAKKSAAKTKPRRRAPSASSRVEE